MVSNYGPPDFAHLARSRVSRRPAPPLPPGSPRRIVAHPILQTARVQVPEQPMTLTRGKIVEELFAGNIFRETFSGRNAAAYREGPKDTPEIAD